MVNFSPLTLRSVRPFGAPLQISTDFSSWQRYCTASISGRQLNFAALNRGRQLCSAGRPSRWALAHILVDVIIVHLVTWWGSWNRDGCCCSVRSAALRVIPVDLVSRLMHQQLSVKNVIQVRIVHTLIMNCVVAIAMCTMSAWYWLQPLVHLSVASQCSIKMAGRIELLFGIASTLPLKTFWYKSIHVPSKNPGTLSLELCCTNCRQLSSTSDCLWFITLSVRRCVQHNVLDAARLGGWSVTAETCSWLESMVWLLFSLMLLVEWQQGPLDHEEPLPLISKSSVREQMEEENWDVTSRLGKVNETTGNRPTQVHR